MGDVCRAAILRLFVVKAIFPSSVTALGEGGEDGEDVGSTRVGKCLNAEMNKLFSMIESKDLGVPGT